MHIQSIQKSIILPLELIDRFKNTKVLVVGDVMLDKYWFGDAIRISPEAPVPVAKIETTDLRAGGAANVARNIASLKGQVTLLSITGDDQPADELIDLLNEENISTIFIRDDTISTTIKLRVIARNQQLIRIDFEKSPNITSIQNLTQKFNKLVNQFDIIILSDYDKGGLKHVQQFIQLANQADIPILVDPKGDDYTKYRGATMITPNLAELKAVIGVWHSESELAHKTEALRQSLQLDAILLTRSEEGLSLFSKHSIEHQTTLAKEIFDVSGAGDTVIASSALCLAAKLTHHQLMKICNAAAGVVVAKVGTATCSIDELVRALNQI